MIAPTDTLTWAGEIVKIEFLILFILMAIVLIGSLIYEYTWRRNNKNIQELESILSKLIKEQIDDFEHFLPRRLKHLACIIPVVEKINKNLSGLYWEFFKEKLIHTLLQKQMSRYFESRMWSKRSWALRTLYISPRHTFEPYVLKNLKDKKTLLRFTAAKCAVKLNTKTSITAALEAMSKEEEMCQYPYRDAILASNLLTFQYITQIYNETTDEALRLSALKILAQKTGYLSFADLQETLYSSNLDFRWWSLRALANSPSKEGVACMLSLTSDAQWQICALASHLLGFLNVTEASTYLEKNLESPNYWVSFASAISLRMLGDEGMKILEKQRPDPYPIAYQTAKHVLKLPPTSFQRGIQAFFPQDPDSLFLPKKATH